MTAQELKETIKVGTKFNTYYGNGEFAGVNVISRLTEKSIFWRDTRWSERTTDTRFSYNTVADYITKGHWK